MRATYQEDTGDVEQKCNGRVEEQHAHANFGYGSPGEGGKLAWDRDEEVHDGADRSKIVESDKGVHLHAIATK